MKYLKNIVWQTHRQTDRHTTTAYRKMQKLTSFSSTATIIFGLINAGKVAAAAANIDLT